MKKLILFITLFLLMCGVAWGGEITGATLTGVTVNPTYMPSYWWPLESDLIPVSGSSTYIGTVTHAGTSRTRVNPTSGLIEAVGANVARFENVGGYDAVLIEPAGTNLVTHSHEFDNAAWTKTRASISADAVVGPDGTLSADKLVEDGTASSTHFITDTIAKELFTDDSDVTFSVYAKSSERTWFRLMFLTKAGTYAYAFFNLATGAVGTETVDNYGSEAAANGFTRYWVTHDIGSGGTDVDAYIHIADADNSPTYNGDGSSGIYIWGAQVEESPIPTSLIVTPGAEVLDDPGLTDAGEWDDTSATVTHDSGAGTVTWSGAGSGYFKSTDSPFTVGELYQIKIVVDSMSAGIIKLHNSSGPFHGTNEEFSSAGTYTLRVTCTNDDRIWLYGDATCDAVVSEISATLTTRLTESGATAFALPGGLFDDTGVAIVWWRPGYGYGDASEDNSGIISTSDTPSSMIFSDIFGGNGMFKSYDGTANIPRANLNWSANTWYKLIVKWGYLVGGDEKFRVGVDSGSGVSWGTAQDFDGSYTLGANLVLGYGLFSRMHLRNLSLYPTVLTDAELDAQGSP